MPDPAGFRIRAIRVSDRPACVAFTVASDPWKAMEVSAAAVRKSLARCRTFVAVDRRAILGYVMIQDGVPPIGGYIRRLVVAPAARNRGVGKALLAFAEKKLFAKSPCVFLCTGHRNSAAKRFYAREGHRVVGKLPDAMVKGQNELILWKSKGPWLDRKARH